jgi:hypothetical protein
MADPEDFRRVFELEERIAELEDEAVRRCLKQFRLEKAVRRCLRQLREVVVFELAPSSWGSDELLLDPPLEGPRWDGMPGTHPMIYFLQEALK